MQKGGTGIGTKQGKPAQQSGSKKAKGVVEFDGNKLRQLREERKWTQQDLASKSGVTRPYIWQLEAGKRHPSKDNIERFSVIFGTTIEAFLQSSLPSSEATLPLTHEVDLVDGKYDSPAQSPETAPSAHEIPLLSIIGYAVGAVRQMNMEVVWGSTLYRDITMSGQTCYPAIPGSVSFTCTGTRSCVQISITLSAISDADLIETVIIDWHLIMPDVLRIATGEGQPILSMVWFTYYASLAERVQYLSENMANDTEFRVTDQKLRETWERRGGICRGEQG